MNADDIERSMRFRERFHEGSKPSRAPVTDSPPPVSVPKIDADHAIAFGIAAGIWIGEENIGPEIEDIRDLLELLASGDYKLIDTRTSIEVERDVLAKLVKRCEGLSNPAKDSATADLFYEAAYRWLSSSTTEAK